MTESISKEKLSDYEISLLSNLFNGEHNEQKYIFENVDKTFFKNGINSNIFETAKKIYDKYDEVTYQDIIISKPSLTEYLADILINGINISCMTKTYCKRLFESRLNEMVSEAKTIEEHEQIEVFKRMYFNNISSEKIRHISDNIDTFLETYNKNRLVKLSTGYDLLDNSIGSFKGGDYITLGGATGMGKTAFALNLANNISKQGKKVLYFSLEMPLKQLQNRLVCMITGIQAKKVRDYSLDDEEMKYYSKGLKELSNINLDIVSEFNLTIDNFRANIEYQKKKGLDFVILDYLGLMNGLNNKSIYEKTTFLSRHIKLIASEFDIPILVLVQLNRGFSDRDDKRPTLSDIRDSGAIEQDSDFVMFTYRDWVYNNNSDKDNLEIIVAKNRHGDLGRVNLHFNTGTQLISNSH